MQVDPARQYWNSYSYVGNNPVMGTDSTGMMNDLKFDLMMHAKNPAHPSPSEIDFGYKKTERAIGGFLKDYLRRLESSKGQPSNINESWNLVSATEYFRNGGQSGLNLTPLKEYILPAGQVHDLSGKGAFLDAGMEGGVQAVHWFNKPLLKQHFAFYEYDTLTNSDSYFGNSTTGIFGLTLGGGYAKGLFWMTPSLKRMVARDFGGDPTETYTKIFPEVNFGPVSIFWGGGYFGFLIGAPGEIGAHTSKPYYRKIQLP